MGDGDLDDFFARKDRKKAGKKIPVPVAATGTATAAPVATSLPNRSGASQDGVSRARAAKQHGANDDEWAELEEKTKDYTGLRIQSLSIKSDEEEEKTVEYDEVSQTLTRRTKEKKTWAQPSKVQHESALRINTKAYPTLSAASQTSNELDSSAVRREARGAHLTHQAPGLALDNKFAGLPDE